MAVIGMGGAARVIGFGVLGLLWLPVLALVPAAVVDRGPEGMPRVSPLPIALATLDPYAWTCVANSVLIAALVAVGSLIIGVGLGTLTSRRRFWGRPLLMGLAWTPLAAGPLILAPGIALILGGDHGEGWDWLDARSVLGFSLLYLAQWAGLVWIGLACGVPIVAAATSAAWTRIDPTWAEAARAVGASRRRVGRDVIWPLLRPDVARSVASVFTLTLLEPAGPLILGLRRTLAVQIVENAQRLDAPSRAASLALLGLAVAWLARLLIGWWGGANTLPPIPEGPVPPIRLAMASRRRALAASLLLGAWIAAGTLPILAVFTRAFAPEAGERQAAVLARLVHPDPDVIVWFQNGFAVAVGSVLATGLALITLYVRPGHPPGRLARGLSSALGWFPPLVIGVGALAIPWLLMAWADAPSPNSAPSRWLARLALEMNPARSPGFVLVIALASTHLPMLARAATLSRGPIQPVLAEAAQNLGATRRRAERDRDGHPARRVPLRPAFLAMVLAITNLAPALLLVPLAERRTPGPGLLGLFLDGGRIDGRAATSLAAILILNLGGYLLAARGRSGPIGGWFRGV